MIEKYITKERDVLTRVTLRVGESLKYTIESPCSDSNMMGLAMNCIEGYLSSLGVPEDKLLEIVQKIVMKETIGYDNLFSMKSEIEFIFEQYDKREIAKCNPGINIIESLVSCMASCAVMATWHPDSINDFLIEYLEVHGVEADIDEEDECCEYKEDEEDECCEYKETETEENKQPILKLH